MNEILLLCNQGHLEHGSDINMGIKAEIDIVIAALQAVLKLVEHVDPNAAQNPVVVEVQKVIDLLKSLGL